MVSISMLFLLSMYNMSHVQSLCTVISIAPIL